MADVAATDLHIAEDALDLIEVEYEPLTPVLDVPEAMLYRVILHDDLHTDELLRAEYGAAGERGTKPSNIAKHAEVSMGDVAKGFAEADVIVEGEFATTMGHQGTSSRTPAWRSREPAVASRPAHKSSLGSWLRNRDAASPVRTLVVRARSAPRVDVQRQRSRRHWTGWRPRGRRLESCGATSSGLRTHHSLLQPVSPRTRCDQ